MLKRTSLLGLCVLATLLGACSKPQAGKETPAAEAAKTNTAAAPAARAESVQTAPSVSAASNSVSPDAMSSDTGQVVSSFDVEKFPVSTAALGDFPYFGFPAGYKPLNKPVSRDLDRVAFWVGDRFEWVEGRTWESGLNTESGKQFSAFEFEKNVDALIRAAGGVKVFEGRIPKDARDSLRGYGHSEGLGDIWNEPAKVYLLRRADRNIWVHMVTYSLGGNWTIAETAPFELTATLIPATE
jgi:hypothetical protein